MPAGASEDDDSRVRIVPERQRAVLDFSEVLVIQGVRTLGTVQGDEGDVIALFDLEMLVGHGAM